MEVNKLRCFAHARAIMRIHHGNKGELLLTAKGELEYGWDA